MYSKSAPEALRRRGYAQSLLLRLTASYTAAAALLVVITMLMAYRELVTDVDREDDRLLRENALQIDALLQHPSADPRRTLLDLENARDRLGALRIRFRILDERGLALVESPGLAAELPPTWFPPPCDPAAADAHGTNVFRDGRQFRLLTGALESEVLGGPGACVQVALDRGSEHQLLTRYRYFVLWVTVPALALCALLGHRIAKRAIRPLEVLAADLGRIRTASLDERLTDRDLATELVPLVDSFHELLGRLASSFRRLRKFSASLAHELRTPINNLCGEIEVALAEPPSPEECHEVLRSCREEAQSLSRILDSLLFLAHAQLPGARSERTRLDVDAELAAIVEFWEAAAAEAGVSLRAAGAGGTFELDRTMLQRALANLLQNAIAFTPRGGAIEVVAERTADRLAITVRDTGKGIPREHLPELLAGLRAGDGPGGELRAGFGLGLDIVQSIVRLHGGDLAIDSDVGAGCSVRMTFAPPG